MIGGVTKNLHVKRGVGAKGGGGLERFLILRGVGQKEGMTFLRGGGSYPGAHYALGFVTNTALSPLL